jgi:prephenate dehydrogenase
LSKEAHLIGITPILNPRYLFDEVDDTLHAHADLFDKGTMLLMPSVKANRDAVELASDFSVLLGATPHFADAVEHDSLAAMTEGLPGLLAVASFYMLSRSRGWNDAQRLTNPSFGRLTHQLFDTHPDDLRDLWLNNRDNLLRQVDDLLTTLQTFRGLLAKADRDALEAALIQSSDAYSAWINRRHSAKWEDDSGQSKAPSFASTMMSGLMGGLLSKRLQGRKNGEDE